VSVLGRATAEGRLKQARAERDVAVVAADVAENLVLSGLAALNAALDRSRSCPCPCRDGLLDVFNALAAPRGGGS
jgi:hypothetical protein